MDVGLGSLFQASTVAENEVGTWQFTDTSITTTLSSDSHMVDSSQCTDSPQHDLDIGSCGGAPWLRLTPPSCLYEEMRLQQTLQQHSLPHHGVVSSSSSQHPSSYGHEVVCHEGMLTSSMCMASSSGLMVDYASVLGGGEDYGPDVMCSSDVMDETHGYMPYRFQRYAANVRERRRMLSINSAFEVCKTCVLVHVYCIMP